MKSESRVKKGEILLFVFVFVSVASIGVSCASGGTLPPEEAWNKAFRGGGEDAAWSVQQTSDGGYILAGITKYSEYDSDVWLVKTNSNGDKQWDNTFGLPQKHDYAHSVQQTSDDGYIIAGATFSFGAGLSDFWLIKTNSKGEWQWDETFGGSDHDWAYSVQQTKDNGFIIAGGTFSDGGGYSNALLVKTNLKGDKEWKKPFGGTADDEAYAVQQTSDEGYILAGRTWSYGAGSCDAWLLKTDSHGNAEWKKPFGGTADDEAYAVQQTSDEGYILAGRTWSYGAGSCDAWLLKTDSQGEEQWNKTFGGTAPDVAYSVQQTTDSGYILAGNTNSFGAGNGDFWLIKVRAEGNSNQIFDTGPGTYPSCPGTHKGEIKPAHDLKVTKLYTYPCTGTGGHTESVEIREGTKLIAHGTWNGYQSDWHNISLHNVTSTPYVSLLKDHNYNYVIRTGSYPQIIHTQQPFTNKYGKITRTQFTDANGMVYNDWLPAIRLV